MPSIRRADLDSAAYRYFEQVGLDLEATRAAIADARDGKLAEVRALRDAAEQEAHRAEERLTRVRRDYADGKLDGELRDLAETPDTGVFRGHARVRAWLAKLQEAWGKDSGSSQRPSWKAMRWSSPTCERAQLGLGAASQSK